jgi:site-specific DNA-cytosine methylase
MRCDGASEWPENLLVDVDLLVGGTPCQVFSPSREHRGVDDERRSPDTELSGPKKKEVME